MRSLWLKLMGAFVLVIIVGLAVVTVGTNRAIIGQFRLYVSRGGQLRAQRLAPLFAEYYAQSGSWQGVETLLQGSQAGNMMGSGMMGRGMMNHGPMGGEKDWIGWGMWSMGGGDRLILADANGVVVADTEGELTGQQLSAAERENGAPVTVGDEMVGTLIIAMAEGRPTPEQDFMDAVNRSILMAGVVAGIIALALGFVLFRHITAPLRALTEAAGDIAAGDLTRRVDIHSNDEMGQLGRAFNTMTEALARQETLRRNMVADIAHELRTPLTVIQGNLEAVLDDVYPLSKQSVADVHRQTLLLSRLVDDLRELALAEAGQLKIERGPVELPAVVAQVVNSVTPQSEEQGVALVTELPPDLPPISGDAQRLRQVFLNLLSNALRHTPRGGRITISARLVDTTVEVRVADTGAGIAPQDLPHVFDRFWRAAPSRTRQNGGTGLGLSIVKQLVEAHGGHIHAESPATRPRAGEPGQGTAFVFTLPVATETR